MGGISSDEDVFLLSAIIWVPGRIQEELSSRLQAGLMGFAPVPVAMEKVLDSFNTSVRISPPGVFPRQAGLEVAVRSCNLPSV